MPLDPRQLEAFVAVVNTGSLGRAAKQLNVTQPALSRIVKRLESRLGVELFERHAAGMDLTTFGEALLPYASFLQDESRIAIEQIDALRGLERGLLRIGTLGSVAVAQVPTIVEQIHITYPNLKIEIVQDVQDRLVALLHSNRLDVVIAGEHIEDEDIVKAGDHTITDIHAVIAAANHPVCAQSSVAQADLIDAHWVMPKADMLPRRQFERLFQELCGTEPNVAVESRSPSTIKAVVGQTQLLGWLPRPMVSAELEAGTLQMLSVPQLEMQRKLCVYRRQRAFVSPQIHCFFEAMSALNQVERPF